MRFSSLLLAALAASACARAADIDFGKQIKPILDARCIECHGPEKQKGKLRLDRAADAFKSAAVIVKGHADESEIFKRISLPPGHDDIMPADGDPLTKEQIESIRDWINQGAKWPEDPQLAVAPPAEEPKAEQPKAEEPAAEPAKETAAPAATVDFEKDLASLFRNRCVDCHGPEKQKGKLRLDSKEATFSGDHPAVIAGNPDESELFRRISLPHTDDDIMPAEGEPLTKAQIELVKNWILQGASWPDGFVIKPAKELLAEKTRVRPDIESPAAEKEALPKLAAMGVEVRAIAMNVNWKEASLKLQDPGLAPKALPLLKDVVTLVDLNLAGTSVTDTDIAHLRALTNLSRLHLENTKVSDASLEHLKELKHLEYLNLYGSAVSDEGLKHLHGLKSLRNIYLWQTKVTSEGAAQLREALPDANINTGIELAKLIEEIQKEQAAKAEEKKSEEKK